MCTADSEASQDRREQYVSSNIVRYLNTLIMARVHDFLSFLGEILCVSWRIFLACFVACYRWLVPLDPKIVRGEIVLVTGAAGWLGRRLAMEFSKLGAVLVLVDINEEGNESAADEMRKHGGDVYTYVCDCRKRLEIYRVATQVRKEVGDISILINNAGTVAGQKFLDMSDKALEDTIDVNMMAHVWTTKAFLPAMLDKNHGHVVNVTSSAGYIAINGLSDYCASKFGAVGLAECLLYELDTLNKDGVHLTNIVPYYFEFGMFSGCNTRFHRLFPPLSSEKVVTGIMKGVLSNEPMVYLPGSIKSLIVVKTLLPVNAFITLMDFLGVTNFMQNFKKSNTDNQPI
ncbi:epidermal retinol dehydrogenase 2-like [Glandiceps talaboti]